MSHQSPAEKAFWRKSEPIILPVKALWDFPLYQDKIKIPCHGLHDLVIAWLLPISSSFTSSHIHYSGYADLHSDPCSFHSHLLAHALTFPTTKVLSLLIFVRIPPFQHLSLYLNTTSSKGLSHCPQGLQLVAI
jgi:hypothetical protein